MKYLFLTVVAVAVLTLASCQLNNVHGTSGGTVSPSSSITGIQIDRDRS